MKGWYAKNNSKTVVVFVHGLFSDSKKCWTSTESVFWPDLLIKDPRFGSPSIFLSEFYTKAGSNDYGVAECAKEVLHGLQREDEKLNPPPIENENIVFVTHSTGGIVVRYILEAYSDIFVGKKIGLCLYASPSYGSKLSSYLGWLANLLNNKLAQELSWGSEILKDLDGRFAHLIYTKKLNISGIEAIENKAPFKVPFLSTRVVEKNSAARYFGNNKIIPNTDHSSIVKPENLSSEPHLTLLDFMVREKFVVIGGAGRLTRPSLFDRYRKEYEEYFVERSKDKELNKVLTQYSVWVYGSTGVGKTASITRAICHNNFDIRYISLGACIGSDIPELFKVINSELSDGYDEGSVSADGSVMDSVKEISDKIYKMNRGNPLCLMIEEIPIQDERKFRDFSNYIYALLNNLMGTLDFRLVLSSICSPDNDVSPELEKISERMKIIEWDVWSDEDIDRLMKVITKDLGERVVGGVLPSAFNGSPREVKNYFRDELLKDSV